MATITETWVPWADGTNVQWSTSSGTSHYALVNDSTRSPSAPSTTTYVEAIATSDIKEEFIILPENGVSSITTVTSITYYIYWQTVDSGHTIDLDVKKGGAWVNLTSFTRGSGSEGWSSYTDSSQPTRSDVLDLQVRIDSNTMTGDDRDRIHVIYAQVTGYSDGTVKKIVRPTGDGSTTSWLLSTGIDHYALVNDSITYPSVEPATIDYIYVNLNRDAAQDILSISSPWDTNIRQVFRADVWLYAGTFDDGTALGLRVNLNIDGGFEGEQTVTIDGTADTYDWYQVTFRSTDWRRTEGDGGDMEVSLQAPVTMTGGDEIRVAVVYVELYYYPISAM